ncbi:MAG: S46 family peptidase [Kofleriaceae bacterium]
MNSRSILCSCLVAACGSGGSNAPVAGGPLGTTHEQSGFDSTGEARVDPTLAFRLGYSNSGGMWMPEQMTLAAHVERFKKMGVQIDPKLLADPLAAPLGAVVQLPGCTGTFVSGEGLIVTNHHCVQGPLQLNSTPDENLVENGFLAKTKADERSTGPGQRVLVAQSFKDITKEVRGGLEAIKDPVARKDEQEKRSKLQIAACEKNRPGIRCQVNAFFRGGKYVLTEALEIRDVRLVYVPARSIGQYGGEIDNWAWPRHTGDFSFYRAYVARDGKPADYSRDNVPFVPKQFVRVSDKGLKAGDFVMVTGYPGSTSRTNTALETHHDVEWMYPYVIAYLKERYQLLEGHLKDGGETSIKATVTKQFVQNSVEHHQGVLKGLTSGDLLQQKDALDKQVKEWAAQPGNEASKQAIEKLEQLVAERQRTARQDYDRGIALSGSSLLRSALSLTRWAEQRTKPDADRKPGYQERDLSRAIGQTKQFAKQYDRKLDRDAFRLALVRALQLPEAERPWLALLLDARKGVKITEATIDKTIDGWYAAQQLEDEKLRLDLIQKGTMAQLKTSKDPFIKAALRVWPTVKVEEKKQDAFEGELLLVTPAYAEAMREVLGGMLAPDANSTLRITYGTVRPFKQGSKQVADWPFTIGSQILAKDKGTPPFDMPKRALEALKSKQLASYADPSLNGELPVNFLSDLDITGGNSGSSTLNDKGELVGLVFDGTIEGVASDVVFNPSSTRAIHVDARYMLWTMDVIDNADHLIREMGLTPRL